MRSYWLVVLIPVVAIAQDWSDIQMALARHRQVSSTSGVDAIPGCVLFLKAAPDYLVFSLDSKVYEWMDISGNNNNAIQSSTSFQPVYVPNVINGRGVLRFSSDRLMLSAKLYTTNATFFMITRKEAGASYAPIGGGNYTYVIGENGTSIRFVNLSGEYWTTPAITSGTLCSVATVATNEVDYRENGADLALTYGGSQSCTRWLNTIGAYSDSDDSYQHNNDIAEIRAWNRKLTSEEISNLEGYASETYGIATHF